MRKVSRLRQLFDAINIAQMNEKTKRILIRRKIRETVTIARDEPLIFVCENCRTEQIFTPVVSGRQLTDEKCINPIPSADSIETKIIKKGEK